MDNLPEKLQALSRNKYFAVAAVVFFAFLTALVFAILALQPGATSTDIRTAVENDNPNSPSGSSQSPTKSPSAFDNFVSILTGKKSSTSAPANTNTSKQGSTTQSGSATTSAPKDSLKEITTGSDIGTPPVININRHTLVTKLPSKPTNVSIYALHTDYTTDDINAFAYKLGFVNIDATEKGDVLTQLYDMDNKHYLGMNAKSGRFTYLSETGFVPQRPASNPMQMAKYLMLQLGIDDPSLKPFATYKRKNDTGNYIYVELHRDWSLFGNPIMNPIGMLNIKENKDLADIKLGALQGFPPVNVNIVDTSDKTDGFARRDDFNTVTVKYQPIEGKVYGISSNIPVMLSSEKIADSAIKSPTEAYKDYTDGKTVLALTAPSGDGSVNLSEVYSGNAATAQNVDVSDAEVMYISAPNKAPQWWCPVYVFRSFGKVQTGFEAQFVHAVSAVKDQRCEAAVLGASTKGLLAQAPTAAPQPSGGLQATQVAKDVKTGSSLQYGTVEFVYQVVVETPVSDCSTEFNHAWQIGHSYDTLEYMMWKDENTTQHEAEDVTHYIPRSWYYVVKKKASSTAATATLRGTKTHAQLMELRKHYLNGCTVGDASECPAPPSINGLETVSCTHITTGSPWIYAYAPTTTPLTISLGGTVPVSYVQPGFTDGKSWKVTAGNSDSETPALHWEYNADKVRALYSPFVSTDRPGFVVETSQLKSFVGELASLIGLNAVESHSLLAEFERPSNQFSTPFVKISFVPGTFLKEYLPLNVSPAPDHLNRVYLELTGLNTYPRVSQPELPQINRDGKAIVEVGIINVK